MTNTFKYDGTVKKVPVEAKAINKEIQSVSKASNVLAPRIHAVLVAAAFHCVEHKDASLVTNLWNSLSNSIAKRNGIGRWISEYTSLALTTDKAGVQKFLGKNKEYTFDTAGEYIAFYAMPGRDPNVMPFDLVKSFIALAHKAANKKDQIKTKNAKALFAAVEKLAIEYEPREESKKPMASTPVKPRKAGTRPANENVVVAPVAA